MEMRHVGDRYQSKTDPQPPPQMAQEVNGLSSFSFVMIHLRDIFAQKSVSLYFLGNKLLLSVYE